MSLSEELRDELAAIAPARACCRLAELSALYHAAGTWHLHGHGELSVHLDLGERRRRTPRLQPPARPRHPLRDPHLPPARLRPRDPLPAPRRGRRPRRRRCSTRRASSRPAGRRLQRPPKRVVGRSCCRGAYLRGALLGAGSLSGPRSPQLELRASDTEGARSLVAVAAPRGGQARLGRAARPRRRLREVGRGDRRPARARRREQGGAPARRARGRRRDTLAGKPARERRRGERQAHRASGAAPARGDPPARPRRAAAPARARSRSLRLRHPSLSLAELAAKCRPPITKAAAHHRLAALVRLADAEEGELRGRTPPLSTHALSR